MRWTADQLRDYELRRGKPQSGATVGVDAGEEGELHRECCRYLTERNIPFVHSRMDRPATVTPGAPDIVAVTSRGVLLVELKTRVGKLSEEQRNWHFLAGLQGHTVHVIRSYAAFVQLLLNSQP